jgi:ATP-binding cassette subfamily F protein 3
LWLVADGNCRPFEDDLDAYRKLVIKQRRMEREKVKQDARAAKKNKGGIESDGNAEEEAQELEQRIADMEQRLHMMEGDIANGFAGKKDAAHLRHLNDNYAALKQEKEAAEAALAQAISRL